MFPRYSRTLIPSFVALALASGTPAGPTAAIASGIPSVGTSTVPQCVPLVGSTSGVVDPSGEFVVVLRDIANNRMPGLAAVFDFSGCGGITLGDAASQTFPGVTIDCTRRRVSVVTDGTGTARFRIVGGAAGGGSAGPAIGCVRVYGNNFVPIGSASVQLYDLDGANGVGGNDLSLWMADFFAPGNPERSRSDYDCNGSVGGNDLALWLGVFNAGGSASSASACP